MKETGRGQRMAALLGSRRGVDEQALAGSRGRVPKGIDDGPKAVELVKLDGPCSHAPGAHIAARASLRAGVDADGSIDSYCVSFLLHRRYYRHHHEARHGVCSAMVASSSMHW